MKRGTLEIKNELQVENQTLSDTWFPVEIWTAIIAPNLRTSPFLTLMTTCKNWLVITTNSEFFKECAQIAKVYLKIITDVFGGVQKFAQIPKVNIPKLSVRLGGAPNFTASDFEGNFCIQGKDSNNEHFIAFYREGNEAQVISMKTFYSDTGQPTSSYWSLSERKTNTIVTENGLWESDEMPNSLLLMRDRYVRIEAESKDPENNNTPYFQELNAFRPR